VANLALQKFRGEPQEGARKRIENKRLKREEKLVAEGGREKGTKRGQ